MTKTARVPGNGKESECGREMKFKCSSCQTWLTDDDYCPRCDELLEAGDEMKFRCPFCRKWVDYSGGCPHFVFSFEKVNYEYLTCVEEFEKRSIEAARGQGFDLDDVPLPLETWVDNDDDGRRLPSLDKLFPGLKFVGYDHYVPRGGGWGILLGFEQNEPRRKPPSERGKASR